MLLGIAIPREVKADEIYKAKATAYCLTGKTASGAYTTKSHTVASKREWFGCTMIVWEDKGDGQIHPENYIGTYVVEDTGSEAIRSGRVIDIYDPCYESCMNFGSKNVIFQIIRSEG